MWCGWEICRKPRNYKTASFITGPAFGQAPCVLTADRALSTLDNEQLTLDLHIRTVALPRRSRYGTLGRLGHPGAQSPPDQPISGHSVGQVTAQQAARAITEAARLHFLQNRLSSRILRRKLARFAVSQRTERAPANPNSGDLQVANYREQTTGNKW